MARLVLNPGTSQAREVLLKPGVNTLGRREDNDLPIPDPSVSGLHCQIIVSDRGVRLKDMGSTNGTFLNGARVTEVELKSGQQIQLGGIQLLFQGDGEAIAAQLTASPAAATVTTAAAARLRIAGVVAHESPAAVAEPEVDIAAAEVPPLAPPEAATIAYCKYHPRNIARWICKKCQKTYCDLCVATRAGSGAGQRFCRTCGGLTAALQVAIEAPQAKSFFRELPRAFVYPFRGTGVMILIVATFIFAVLDFVGGRILGLFIKMMAIGYLFSYVQNIIHTTAAGDDRLPDLPGMDDLLSGFFRLIGTVLISFGPALALAYFAIAQAEPMAGIAVIPAVIFGCIYLPMAFLAVAIKDTLMASNPLVVVPSIVRVPLEYLVTVILIAGIFGVRWLGDLISAVIGGRSLMTHSITEMLLLFVLRAIWAFVSVYLLTVTMRILGLLYLTKRDRLGW